MPVDWRGTRLVSCKDFPILVKFIFPQDKLSIQVHPDDAYAAATNKLPAAGAKPKCGTRFPQSRVRACYWSEARDRKERISRCNEQNRLEDAFQSHSVTAGDTFFVAAGTPHTIGPRMILCEVQEYSDLTYRVYDYGASMATENPANCTSKRRSR